MSGTIRPGSEKGLQTQPKGRTFNLPRGRRQVAWMCVEELPSTRGRVTVTAEGNCPSKGHAFPRRVTQFRLPAVFPHPPSLLSTQSAPFGLNFGTATTPLYLRHRPAFLYAFSFPILSSHQFTGHQSAYILPSTHSPGRQALKRQGWEERNGFDTVLLQQELNRI